MAGEVNYSEMYYSLKNGVNMPAVGLGTMGIKNYKVMFNAIDHALEDGYRLFDTAGVFGNEKLIKNAFRHLLAKHGLVREEIFITTKLAPVTCDAKSAVRSFEKSLHNLGMDYIDLYLLQYPALPDTDPRSSRNAKMRAATWMALTKLYDESKIKAIGVSNFNIRHLIHLDEVMRVGPMVNQIEWHPYYFQPEMLQYCSENNIQIQAYSSFGGLSSNNEALVRDAVVRDIANRYDGTPHQVLLVWALQKGVAVIPKASNADHIKENKTLNFRLSDEDMAQLDALGAKNRKYDWDPSLVV